ncbi:MAG: hypothetical protein KatS3mg105_4761 [Gemmatales bacterium]|nr:MAG: hypothetical protein KatS3mg105_4761 [Gemmatales bacterium]
MVATTLQKQIQQIVAEHPGTQLSADRSRSPLGQPFAYDLLSRTLRRLVLHADIGTKPPPCRSFRGPFRLLARWVTRLVSFVSRFLTDQQRDFNRTAFSVLETLTQLSHNQGQRLGEAETTIQILRDKLRQSEEQIFLLREQVVFLERRVADLADEVRKRLAGVAEGDVPTPLRADHRRHLEGVVAVLAQKSSVRADESSYTLCARLLKNALPADEAAVADIYSATAGGLLALATEGLNAYGIESNGILASCARRRGLQIAEAEPLDYLASLPPDSLGAATCFDCRRQFTLGEFVTLLDAVLRVLRPKGVVLIHLEDDGETHVPVPSVIRHPDEPLSLTGDFVAFLLESRGFRRVQKHRLHSADNDWRQACGLPEKTDVAVVGCKP